MRQEFTLTVFYNIRDAISVYQTLKLSLAGIIVVIWSNKSRSRSPRTPSPHTHTSLPEKLPRRDGGTFSKLPQQFSPSKCPQTASVCQSHATQDSSAHVL